LEYGNHGQGLWTRSASSIPGHGQESGDVLWSRWALCLLGTAHQQHDQPPPGFGSTSRSRCGCGLRCLFANFAGGHGRGPRQGSGDTLRKAKGETIALRYTRTAALEEIASGQLRAGDLIYVEANHYIAGDGEVIEGVASVDESAIMANRPRSSARPAATLGRHGGQVLSDWIKVASPPTPENLPRRMIALVEGATAQKTPTRSRSAFCSPASPSFSARCGHIATFGCTPSPQTVFVLVSLLGLPDSHYIGGLLSAMGLPAWTAWSVQRLAMSGRAVEAAGTSTPCCSTRPAYHSRTARPRSSLRSGHQS